MAILGTIVGMAPLVIPVPAALNGCCCPPPLDAKGNALVTPTLVISNGGGCSVPPPGESGSYTNFTFDDIITFTGGANGLWASETFGDSGIYLSLQCNPSSSGPQIYITTAGFGAIDGAAPDFGTVAFTPKGTETVTMIGGYPCSDNDGNPVVGTLTWTDKRENRSRILPPAIASHACIAWRAARRRGKVSGRFSVLIS